MGDEEFVQTVSIACRLIAKLLLMNVVLVVFGSQLLFGHEVESSTIYHLAIPRRCSGACIPDCIQHRAMCGHPA